MKFKSAMSLIGLLFLSMIIVFQNCSRAQFTSTEMSSNALNNVTGNDGGDNNSTCQPHLVTENRVVKVLFAIDNSGSNRGTYGTDPNKKWRSATFSNFISQYSAKSNFHYGLITFQATAAQAHIKVNGSAGFTNDLALVESGYQSFINTPDGDSTPYKAALNMAKDMISADLAANKDQKASYVVVMVSDGEAKDYKTPEEVIPDVEAIKALAPGQISINSVYYYSMAFTESWTKYLRNISSAGGGSFIIANSNQVLAIDDVIQVPKTSCQ